MLTKWASTGLAALALTACALWPLSQNLDGVIGASHRTDEFRARDVHRHPKETLQFFGLRPDQTVVEIWPGTGWYMEILAPYLRREGRYYAAGYVVSGDNVSDYRRRTTNQLLSRMSRHPDVYDRAIVTELGPPDRWQPAPPGSADLVVTFRNVHNWISGDYEAQMFQAFHRTLKPGGVLGVVEHRARPGTSRKEMKDSGYVTEAYVIELAERAGFRLDARSEINANPRDTRDHPKGVWTLPPTLRLGDVDREKYLAIGESDRMTLRFIKPGPPGNKAQAEGKAG